ncbi:MAG: hypothetical protein OHK0017_07380 [Patescibacteria group bacterium]
MSQYQQSKEGKIQLGNLNGKVLRLPKRTELVGLTLGLITPILGLASQATAAENYSSVKSHQEGLTAQQLESSEDFSTPTEHLYQYRDRIQVEFRGDPLPYSYFTHDGFLVIRIDNFTNQNVRLEIFYNDVVNPVDPHEDDPVLCTTIEPNKIFVLPFRGVFRDEDNQNSARLPTKIRISRNRSCN